MAKRRKENSEKKKKRTTCPENLVVCVRACVCVCVSVYISSSLFYYGVEHPLRTVDIPPRIGSDRACNALAVLFLQKDLDEERESESDTEH